MEELLKLLPWVLPPLLGAVIGYVTNALAIKMLFRPLREYRIWGFRVPFTPGIIPRQRGALARSFGLMVSTQLVTSDTVLNHLSRQETQIALGDALTLSLQNYAEKPLASLLPHQGDENEQTPLEQNPLQEISQRLKASIQSGPFESFVTRFLERLVPALLQSQPINWIKNGRIFWVRVLIMGRRFLKKHDGRERFLSFVKDTVEKIETEKSSFGEILGTSGLQAITEAVQLSLPFLSQALLGWMDRPLVRAQLESTGLVFLEQIIGKLSGFQRFIVSSVQYDKTLKENIPEIIGDLRDHLADYLFTPKSKELFDSLTQGVEKILQNPWSQWPPARRETFKRLVLDGSASFFDQLLPQLLTVGTAQALETNLKPALSMTLEEISAKSLGWKAGDWVQILRTQLFVFLEKLLEGQGPLPGLVSQSPAQLFSLQERDYQKASAFLTQSALRALEDSLPRLLAGLNIQAMVEDKINGLEMKQVEDLLMMVIKKHLKWINIIGAFLGALIGLSQVFLQL